MDSPPSDAVGFTRKHHHTPHTVPRTRLPAGTPVAERLAMESLRQQLSFEEEAEVCIKVFLSVATKLKWLTTAVICSKVNIGYCLIYTQPVDQTSRSRASRNSQNPSSSTANNERTLPTQTRTSASASLPVLEMNETETTRASTDGAINSTSSKVQILYVIHVQL